MSAPNDRPPPGLSIAAFFEQWLPGAFVAGLSPGRQRSVEVDVRVCIEGEGGGAWDVRVQSGGLFVEEPRAGERSLTIRQSVRDFRALAWGEPPAHQLVPARGTALDLLFIDPQLQQLIQTVRGTVRLEVTDYNGRDWQITLKLGAGPAPDAPDAVISIDADTHARIVARTLAPPEAFFSGRVKITGNAALAMQLAMALLPKMV